MDNRNWDTSKEEECLNIANRSEALVWLYNETASYYNKINNILTAVIVIGGYLFGVSGIPTLFAGDWDYSKYINLFIQFCVVMISVLGTFKKIWSFENKIDESKMVSMRFSTIFLDIKRELNKSVIDRTEYNTFYDKISGDELESRKTMVHIPTIIINKYRDRMGSSAIPYRDLFIDKINIRGGKKDDILELSKYL